LAISTDGGTNYTEVNGVKDVSLSVDGKVLDATDHDSGDWEEFIGGRNNGKLSASLNYDKADAGQDACWTAAKARTKVWFRYRPKAVASEREWKQAGIITSIKAASGNNDLAMLSLEIQLSGTPTDATQ
jgi:hypothetical protein